MSRDTLLIWNGLVTRVRRSAAETQDGRLTPTTSAKPGRRAGSREPATGTPLRSGNNDGLVPEPTPTDPDLP